MAMANNVLHHEVLLSTYAQRWTPPQEDWLLADEIFPEVPVDKPFDAFKKINQSVFMQTAATEVGPSGDVAQVEAAYDPDGTFKTKPHAIEGKIDLLESETADDVAMYEQNQLDLPMSVLKNTLEVEAWSKLFTDIQSYSDSYENVDAGEMFDVIGPNSNPILYIRKKCEIIMGEIGRKPNRLALDYLAWRALIFNPASQQIAPVHTVPAGLQHLTIEMVEEKLKDVLEPKSIRITRFRRETARGAVSQANSKKRSVIGPNMVIAYVEPPSRNSVSALQKFAFVGKRARINDVNFDLVNGDPRAPIGVYSYPMPNKGQQGSIIVKVITNVTYDLVRPQSIFVSLGVVDKTNESLYRKALQ